MVGGLVGDYIKENYLEKYLYIIYMIPIAEVIKQTATQYIVRCPYCEQKHSHGKMEGDRLSHCYITKKNKKLIEERHAKYESTCYDVRLPVPKL